MSEKDTEQPTIYTCGYGGMKTFDELKALLDKHGITSLVDIRSVPYSRKWSITDLTWSREDMHEYFGARYIHQVTMGGKGFEPHDYLRWQGVAGKAIMEVVELARKPDEKVAIMCSEKHWQKCHRNYLAGRAFKEMGFKIIHLP